MSDGRDFSTDIFLYHCRYLQTAGKEIAQTFFEIVRNTIFTDYYLVLKSQNSWKQYNNLF